MTDPHDSVKLPEIFPQEIYSRRLTRVQQHLRDRGLGGVIIGSGPELAYLLSLIHISEPTRRS